MSARGYAAIRLDGTLHDVNVGSVLRAAQVFDAGLVAVRPGRDIHRDRRWTHLRTDTTRAYRHRPFLIVDELLPVRPVGAALVVVEIGVGGQFLRDFQHPATAFYVFGPEQGGLDGDIYDQADAVVEIESPTSLCVNLATAVHLVLYDRWVKHLAARELP